MSVRAEVRNASVRLGSVQALDEVDLVVEPGQFLSVLGPSGSGKTTALNVLAGFIRPDNGLVLFDEEDMSAIPPQRRDLGIVFQGYALFPHMTVAENVSFPLRMRKLEKGDKRRKVLEALDLVGLAELSDRSVTTLSGGQKQRVALARAVVFEPRMMLLDEPLGALDKQLRDQMQLELRRLQRRVGITTVAVTHDQVEALTMADVVAVMRDGHIEQVATPENLYLHPQTTFVARFLGEADLVPVHNGYLVGFGPLGNELNGQAVIRPEYLSLAEGEPTTKPAISAQAAVLEVTFQGSRYRIRVRLLSRPEIELTVSQPAAWKDNAVVHSDEVTVALDTNLVHVIPNVSGGSAGAYANQSAAPYA